MRPDGFDTAQHTAVAEASAGHALDIPSRTVRDLGWVVAGLLGGVLLLMESARLVMPIDPSSGASPLGRYLAAAAQALGGM